MKDALAITAILAGLVIGVLLVIGWVMNIITLANATELNGITVVRAIGVFLPFIGGIAGWF